jgi:hypothetical protein
VIGGEDAEVADAGPELIKRSERDALFEIIFVGHQAALGTAAGSGGIDDGGEVLAFTRNECGGGVTAEFFPTMGAGEIGV